MQRSYTEQSFYIKVQMSHEFQWQSKDGEKPGSVDWGSLNGKIKLYFTLPNMFHTQ